MNASAHKFTEAAMVRADFTRNARLSFIGSKILQATGLETERQGSIYQAMWLRLIDNHSPDASAKDQSDHLAISILAVATLAEDAAVAGGSKAAIAAVMRESGQGLDPMIAQNFIRLASSPIFWMALDSAGEARA